MITTTHRHHTHTVHSAGPAPASSRSCSTGTNKDPQFPVQKPRLLTVNLSRCLHTPPIPALRSRGCLSTLTQFCQVGEEEFRSPDLPTQTSLHVLWEVRRTSGGPSQCLCTWLLCGVLPGPRRRPGRPDSVTSITTDQEGCCEG